MTRQAWQLRRATAADLESIMAIETATFTTDAWSREAMSRELASDHRYYLVASEPEHPESIDGYAGLLAPDAGGQGDIQTIAVAVHARHRGLGRTLVQALLIEARKRGAGEVFLEVRADNPVAIDLYHSLGFEELGVRAGYYQPDNVDAIVMRVAVPKPATTIAGAQR